MSLVNSASAIVLPPSVVVDRQTLSFTCVLLTATQVLPFHVPYVIVVERVGVVDPKSYSAV
jgi:hypothetical protein